MEQAPNVGKMQGVHGGGKRCLLCVYRFPIRVSSGGSVLVGVHDHAWGSFRRFVDNSQKKGWPALLEA